MTLYYHTTPVEKQPLILREGLIPQANFRVFGYMEMNMDLQRATYTSDFLHDTLLTDHTYLWLKPRDNVSDDQVQLEVDLSDDIAVEKDYFQVLDFYLGCCCSPQNLHTVGEGLEHFGGKLERELDADNFESDIRAIISAVDAISTEVWNEKIGAYRTSEEIPESRVKVYRKSGSSKWLSRLAGLLKTK